MALLEREILAKGNDEKLSLDILRDYLNIYDLKRGKNFILLLFLLGLVSMEKYRIGIKIFIPNQIAQKIIFDLIKSIQDEISY